MNYQLSTQSFFRIRMIIITIFSILIFTSCSSFINNESISSRIERLSEDEIPLANTPTVQKSFDEESFEKKLNAYLEKNKIPDYSTEPYFQLNNGKVFFTQKDKSIVKSFEKYEDLDVLGCVRGASACIGKDLMPKEERGNIGNIKPAGWHTIKYDFIDGKYLYNRCHLIGFQLTGQNDNEKNLMTGTRYFNIEGMLPFENMVADYIKETGNHVIYRVTPLYYSEKDLVSNGVIIEAFSIEDKGDGIEFNVFVYNVQPGVFIDYSTGDNESAESAKGNKGISSQANKSEKNSSEEVNNLKVDNQEEIVYWVPKGKVYHCKESCSALSRSKTILEGPLSECPKSKPCSKCY